MSAARKHKSDIHPRELARKIIEEFEKRRGKPVARPNLVLFKLELLSRLKAIKSGKARRCGSDEEATHAAIPAREPHKKDEYSKFYRMLLPEGKTCGDCIQFDHCRQMIGAIHQDEVCDWSPSKFKARQAGEK